NRLTWAAAQNQNHGLAMDTTILPRALLCSGLLGASLLAAAPADPPRGPPTAEPPTHWAFRPVALPAVPLVRNAAWVRNPIDALVAARHEAKGLRPAPEASRRVLIRRLSFDLMGLPPTPAEVEAFVADRARDAYEKL